MAKQNDVTTNKNNNRRNAANYEEGTDKEMMQAEGAKYKAALNNEGSHAEGQYDKKNDKPTMHPGSADTE